LRDVLIDLDLELGCIGLVRHGSHPIASRFDCLAGAGAEIFPAGEKASLTSDDEDRWRDRFLAGHARDRLLVVVTTSRSLAPGGSRTGQA
jgi:hypothetical protein